MEQPTVCAVMLTKDRPAMAARAVRAFKSQTYANKRLMVYGSDQGSKESIGALRNHAIVYGDGLCKPSHKLIDIFIHWDDDDWSHPRRIEEQVAHLISSGADAVGYNEMLFCEEAKHEAWLYRNGNPNYCLGTSLCYWRKTWEAHPFPDCSIGEDTKWLDQLWQAGMKTEGISADRRKGTEQEIRAAGLYPAPGYQTKDIGLLVQHEPRMIASVHGGNTSTRIIPNVPEWTRVPEWDAYCEKEMRLNAL